MQIFVETERLLLREIIAEDAPDFFEIDSDPAVHTYLGNSPISSLAESRQMITDVRSQYEKNGIGRWAIIDKLTNYFIGWSGLKLEDVVRKEFNYYDLGYRLKQKYWGRGYATEAAVASLQYGFEQMQLPEICAAADVNNMASNKILQKVGLSFIEAFDFEGILHNWYQIKHDDYLSLNND